TAHVARRRRSWSTGSEVNNMTNRLGWYFRAKRMARGLSVEALATTIGYRNLRKGAHRIIRFEHDGQCPHTLLVNLADALGISSPTILDILDRDARQPAFPSLRIASGRIRCCRAAHGPSSGDG